MTNIHITGTSGYISTNLSKHLSSSYDITTSCRSASPSNGHSINYDDVFSIARAIHGSDLLIHAAGPSSRECSVATIPRRVQHISNLLTACKKQNVSRLIYLSTIHVYRSPLLGLINESSPTTPSSDYALTHLAAEEVILKDSNINVLILRLPNIFGGLPSSNHSSDLLLTHSAIRTVSQSTTLSINSSGFQYINLLPIEIFCLSIEHLIKQTSTPLILNLPGVTTTVLSLLKSIVDVGSTDHFSKFFRFTSRCPLSSPIPPLIYTTNHPDAIGYHPDNISLLHYLSRYFTRIP